MHRRNLAAAAVAAAIMTVALPGSINALTVAMPSGLATSPAHPAQRTAVVCGPFGCGHIWRGPRYREPGWGRPWGYVYPPACPLDHYYACRRGPLGYPRCACWPYRPY